MTMRSRLKVASGRDVTKRLIIDVSAIVFELHVNQKWTQSPVGPQVFPKQIIP